MFLVKHSTQNIKMSLAGQKGVVNNAENYAAWCVFVANKMHQLN